MKVYGSGGKRRPGGDGSSAHVLAAAYFGECVEEARAGTPPLQARIQRDDAGLY